MISAESIKTKNLINKYLTGVFVKAVDEGVIRDIDFENNLDVINLMNKANPARKGSFSETLIKEPSLTQGYVSKGYFFIKTSKKGHNDLLIEISRRFNGTEISKVGDYYASVWIKTEFLDQYYQEYFLQYKGILTFPHGCREILWNKSIVKKYKDEIFNVGLLLFLPYIHWTVEDLEVLKDKINWIIVTSLDNFHWDIPSINKFRDYLIFSRAYNYCGKGNRMHSFPNEPDYFSNGCPENKSYSLNSLSSCKNVQWDTNLIEQFNDYWDWRELSLNEAISWTDAMIRKFENRIDFECLSNNESVNWSWELIEKYVDKWDWESLSGNERLPWDKYDFFIDRYRSFWTWKPDKVPALCFNPWPDYNINTKPRSIPDDIFVFLNIDNISAKSISTNISDALI